MKDHRELGQIMDLFSFHEESPGAVYWHPKGWMVYQELMQLIRSKLSDYQEISTPVMARGIIFEKSGHLNHYKDNMFRIEEDAVDSYLKPMNCPESTLIYANTIRSYKDLPMRYADFGILHRNELSGSLGWLFRLRQFTQDDAHIFCIEDQIQGEIETILQLMDEIYTQFNFSPIFYLSTKPNKAMGTEDMWIRTEMALKQALSSQGKQYVLKPQDGAFYGPKIDVHIKDSLGREWQLGTIQLDFQIPKQMKLKYVDPHGILQTPVIIHRALLGSLERFIGILLEHYNGLPFSLSPIQVAIIIVSKESIPKLKLLQPFLPDIRHEIILGQTVGKSVREAVQKRIPLIMIIGEKEMNAPDFMVSLRNCKGKQLQIKAKDLVAFFKTI